MAALGAIVNAHIVQGVKDYAGPFAKAILPIIETGGGSGGFSFSNVPDSIIRSFLDGLQLALLIATIFIVAAGVLAALVREPPALDDAADD